MIFYSLPLYEQRTIAVLNLANKSFLEIAHALPSECPNDGRSATFYALQSLGVEHLRAIIKLCESGDAIGSAMALFRPMADAIVRAEWLYFCADPLILEKFWKNEFRFGGPKYKFEKLAAEIDKRLGVLTAYQPMDSTTLPSVTGLTVATTRPYRVFRQPGI